MLRNGKWKFLVLSLVVLFAVMFLGTAGADTVHSDENRVAASPQLKIDFPTRGSLIRFFYSENGEQPPDVEMYISTSADAQDMHLLGRIEPEGEAAKIESVFTYDVDGDGHKELFVLARWEVSHPGLKTSGNLFRTYVYKASISRNEFSRMEHVEEVIGSGMDGIREGKEVHYPYRDAGSIRKLLGKLRKHS